MEGVSTLQTDVQSWSLGTDIKLLNILREFSNNLIEKTNLTTNKIDDLHLDILESEIRLRNTFNEFLMLSNTQFVENRVYDDDGNDGDDEEKNSSEDIAISEDPMTSLKIAFSNGVEAIKLFYIDDDVSNDKIEDIYNMRAMPFIYNTSAYHNSIDGGLSEVYLEEPDEPEEDNKNSINDNTDEENRNYQHNEEDHRRFGRRYTRSNEEDNYEENYDGNNNNDNEYDEDKPVSQPSLSSLLANQIKSRTGAQVDSPESRAGNKQIIDEEDEDKDETDDLFNVTQDDPYSLFGGSTTNTANRISTKSKRDSLSDLFGDTTSLFERERSDSISSQISSNQGRLKKPSISNLFGDTNDNSLFDEVVEQKDIKKDIEKSLSKTVEKQAEKPIEKPVESAIDKVKEDEDFIDDNDDDLFSFTKKSNVVKTKSIRSLDTSDLFGSGGLFDDIVPSKPTTNVTTTSNNKITSNKGNKLASLFDDDLDNDIFNTKTTTNKKVDSISDIKVENKVEKKVDNRKSVTSSLFDDDDSDIFASKKPVSKPTATNTASSNSANSIVATSSSKSNSDLFGDDDDGDIFIKKPTTTSNTNKPTPSTSAKPVKKSIFDDDDEEELFLNKTNSQTNEKHVQKIIDSNSIKPIVKEKSSNILFDDSNINKTNKLSVTKSDSNTKSSLLFDDDNDDADLFSNKSTKPIVKSQVKPVSKEVIKKSSGLFDEDDDSIVPSSKPIESVVKQISAPYENSSKEIVNAVVKSNETTDYVNTSLFDEKSIISDSDFKPVETSNKKSNSSLFDDDVTDILSTNKPITKVLSDDSSNNQESNSGKNKPAESASDNTSNINKIKANITIDPTKLLIQPSRNLLVKPRVIESDDDSGSEKNFSDSDDLPKVSSKNLVTKVTEPIVNDVPVLEEKVKSHEEPVITATINSKRMSGGLANRIAGLDPSKIIMPGIGMPKSIIQKPVVVDNESSDISNNTSDTTNVKEEKSLNDNNLDRPVVNRKSRKLPAKKIFTDDLNDVSVSDNTTANLSNDNNYVISKIDKSESLFEDTVKISNNNKVTTSLSEDAQSSNNTTKSSLFDSKDEFLLSNPSTLESNKVLTTNNLLTSNQSISKKVYDDYDDDSDIIYKTTAKSDSLLKDTVSSKKSSSLFDTTDDIISTKTTVKSDSLLNEKSHITKDIVSSTKSSSLFDTTDDIIPSITTIKSDSLLSDRSNVTKDIVSSTKPSSLFDTAEDTISLKKALVSSNDSTKKKSIFEDDNDDFLFTKPVAKSSTSPVKDNTISKSSSKLFDDLDDNDSSDLFKSNSSNNASTKSNSIKKETSKKSSLFGDDEDDPLFSNKNGLFD
eukprot:gene20511-26605_t